MTRSTLTRLTDASLLILFLAGVSIFFMEARHTAFADSPSMGRQGGATVSKGFPCGVVSTNESFLITTDSHEVQTPSGEANLVCHATTSTPPSSE